MSKMNLPPRQGVPDYPEDGGAMTDCVDCIYYQDSTVAGGSRGEVHCSHRSGGQTWKWSDLWDGSKVDPNSVECVGFPNFHPDCPVSRIPNSHEVENV